MTIGMALGLTRKTLTTICLQASTRARSTTTAWRADEGGATAIEYALIAGFIALVCVPAFTLVGSASGGGWGTMSTKVIAAMTK